EAPDRGRTLTVLQAMEPAAAKLDAGELSREPLVAAAARQTVGATLRRPGAAGGGRGAPDGGGHLPRPGGVRGGRERLAEGAGDAHPASPRGRRRGGGEPRRAGSTPRPASRHRGGGAAVPPRPGHPQEDGGGAARGARRELERPGRAA